MALTKARLSVLVVVTSFVGYLAAAKRFGFDGWTLVHCLAGTTLAAFAAAVFNQILETEADSLMRRTADRPLPAKRLTPTVAFAIGWSLAALGLVHLLVKVGLVAAGLAAATLGIYLFVYTPLKRVSSANTLVGAVSGALPPLIGWVAGGGSLGSWQALCLFALLFFWQLPHFVAINWIYRDEYVKGGFVMWSNTDESGRKSGWLAVVFTVCLFPVFIIPAAAGFAGWIYPVAGLACTGAMLHVAWGFLRTATVSRARRLFFATLLYLPATLVLTAICWH